MMQSLSKSMCGGGGGGGGGGGVSKPTIVFFFGELCIHHFGTSNTAFGPIGLGL